MGVSEKSAGDTISFSDINDEFGNSSTQVLDLKSAGDAFSGISTDGVYSINEFYGKEGGTPVFSSFSVIPSTTTTGRIDISWGTSGQVNTFSLKRATSIDGNGDLDENETLVYSTNNGSFTQTSLSNTGTSLGLYYYQATATNTDPNPNVSVNSSVQSGLLLPTATSLSATANTAIGGRIDLSWTKNGVVTQQDIIRSSNSNMSSPDGTNGIYSSNIGSGTTFSDTGVSGTKYYQVKVYNTTGNTLSNSDGATATSAIARNIGTSWQWTWDGDNSPYDLGGWTTNQLFLALSNSDPLEGANPPTYLGSDPLQDGMTLNSDVEALTTTIGGWNNGYVAKKQSNLSTFDGGGRIWRNADDEKLHQIASNGVISNTVPFLPPNPTISQVSKTHEQIVVQVAGDFRLANTIRWLISPNANSQNNTTTTNHSKGTTSNGSGTYNRTFTGLSASTSYTIQARLENSSKQSGYGSTTITTDSTPVTSFSVVGNTGLHLGGGAGDTGTSLSDAEITLTNGSGGCSGAISTTGGPFGSFRVAVASDGDPGSGGSTGDGTGFLSQTNINLNAMYTNWNSGTRYHRTRWIHSPSNKDGTGTYTWTITNNSVTTTITGNINFGGPGGLCIYENILVNTPSGKSNINDLQVGDMVKSWNFKTKEVEEVPILDIIKPIHDDLIKVSLEDPNQEDWLNEIVLTTDHPIYKQDGTLVSGTPDLSKSRYNVETNTLKVNDYIAMLDGKYYAKVTNVENFEGEHNTYTILTKNNNFYAGGVLVHSEIEKK